MEDVNKVLRCVKDEQSWGAVLLWRAKQQRISEYAGSFCLIQRQLSAGWKM